MLITILHTQNFIKIHQFVLKILNGNTILTSIKDVVVRLYICGTFSSARLWPCCKSCDQWCGCTFLYIHCTFSSARLWSCCPMINDVVVLFCIYIVPSLLPDCDLAVLWSMKWLYFFVYTLYLFFCPTVILLSYDQWSGCTFLYTLYLLFCPIVILLSCDQWCGCTFLYIRCTFSSARLWSCCPMINDVVVLFCIYIVPSLLLDCDLAVLWSMMWLYFFVYTLYLLFCRTVILLSYDQWCGCTFLYIQLWSCCPMINDVVVLFCIYIVPSLLPDFDLAVLWSMKWLYFFVYTLYLLFCPTVILLSYDQWSGCTFLYIHCTFSSARLWSCCPIINEVAVLFCIYIVPSLLPDCDLAVLWSMKWLYFFVYTLYFLFCLIVILLSCDQWYGCTFLYIHCTFSSARLWSCCPMINEVVVLFCIYIVPSLLPNCDLTVSPMINDVVVLFCIYIVPSLLLDCDLAVLWSMMWLYFFVYTLYLLFCPTVILLSYDQWSGCTFLYIHCTFSSARLWSCCPMINEVAVLFGIYIVPSLLPDCDLAVLWSMKWLYFFVYTLYLPFCRTVILLLVLWSMMWLYFFVYTLYLLFCLIVILLSYDQWSGCTFLYIHCTFSSAWLWSCCPMINEVVVLFCIYIVPSLLPDCDLAVLWSMKWLYFFVYTLYLLFCPIVILLSYDQWSGCTFLYIHYTFSSARLWSCCPMINEVVVLFCIYIVPSLLPDCDLAVLWSMMWLYFFVYTLYLLFCPVVILLSYDQWSGCTFLYIYCTFSSAQLWSCCPMINGVVVLFCIYIVTFSFAWLLSCCLWSMMWLYFFVYTLYLLFCPTVILLSCDQWCGCTFLYIHCTFSSARLWSCCPMINEVVVLFCIYIVPSLLPDCDLAVLWSMMWLYFFVYIVPSLLPDCDLAVLWSMKWLYFFVYTLYLLFCPTVILLSYDQWCGCTFLHTLYLLFCPIVILLSCDQWCGCTFLYIHCTFSSARLWSCCPMINDVVVLFCIYIVPSLLPDCDLAVLWSMMWLYFFVYTLYLLFCPIVILLSYDQWCGCTFLYIHCTFSSARLWSCCPVINDVVVLFCIYIVPSLLPDCDLAVLWSMMWLYFFVYTLYLLFCPIVILLSCDQWCGCTFLYTLYLLFCLIVILLSYDQWSGCTFLYIHCTFSFARLWSCCPVINDVVELFCIYIVPSLLPDCDLAVL